MNRAMLKVIAAGAISLAIGLQPALATADGLPLEPTATAPRLGTEAITAPFDPICPLCFLREMLESGS